MTRNAGCFVTLSLLIWLLTWFGIPVRADSLTGPQVVAKCKAAYDGMTSYSGSVECSATLTSAPGSVLRGTSQIAFLRPDYLDVEGTNPVVGKLKPPFSLLSNGTATWVKWAGTWSKQRSVEMGIAVCAGISFDGATTIPATLLHTHWGYPVLFDVTAPASVTQETVNGQLACKIPLTVSGMSETYWVDAKSFLIVKVETATRGIVFTELYARPLIDSPIALNLYALPMQMPR